MPYLVRIVSYNDIQILKDPFPKGPRESRGIGLLDPRIDTLSPFILEGPSKRGL